MYKTGDMERDAEHLRLLSIFYYIKGAIGAFFSCFFLIYIVMGLAMAAAPHHGHNAPPAVMGVIFIVIGLFMVTFGWVWAALQLAAGFCLSRRRHRIFCMVVAGFSCALVPYGTILGIFTFIVLQRPSVRQMFDQPPAPQTFAR